MFRKFLTSIWEEPVIQSLYWSLFSVISCTNSSLSRLASSSLKGFLRLKDTRFRVLEDYPKEIIESRRKLVPLLKEAKAQGKKAHFCKPMPDRLIIDGKFIDS